METQTATQAETLPEIQAASEARATRATQTETLPATQRAMQTSPRDAQTANTPSPASPLHAAFGAADTGGVNQDADAPSPTQPVPLSAPFHGLAEPAALSPCQHWATNGVAEGGIEAEMLLIRNALPDNDVVQRVQERLSLLGVCLCAHMQPHAGEMSARLEEAPAATAGGEEEEDKQEEEPAHGMPEEIAVPVGQMPAGRAGEQEDVEEDARRGAGRDAEAERLQAARRRKASMDVSVDLSIDLWLPALERRRLLVLSCQVTAQ